MVIASQTSVDTISIFLIKKSKIVKQDSTVTRRWYISRFKYFPGALSWDIFHYVNPTLGESEFDVAIIHIGINNLLNCEDDIDQINNILRNIEHIIYKCRQCGVKIYSYLGQQLQIGFLNSWLKNLICRIEIDAAEQQIVIIDNANITLNEVSRDGLHLSGKGKYVLINNYLDKVLNFLEVALFPWKNTHRGTLVWMKIMFCRTIYKYWKMQY